MGDTGGNAKRNGACLVALLSDRPGNFLGSIRQRAR